MVVNIAVYFICHCDTLAQEYRGGGFKLRYRQIHSDLDEYLNVCPLSLSPIPIGSLRSFRDVDICPYLSLCLSLKGISVTRKLGLYFCCQHGSNSTSGS